MRTLLFPAWIYYLAISGLAFLFACTLPHRIEHFDDAWFAEQVYWLLKDGWVRSEFFRGLNFWEDQLYVFHKAFIYVQAPILYLSGFSVIGAKTTPLLFALMGLGLLLYYFRGQGEAQALAVALYLGCGTLVLFSFDNRPETMVMALGFASYVVMSGRRAGYGSWLAAGGLAGLAALTHLNGLVYVVAGVAYLVMQRGWRPALAFALTGGFVTSLYFLDAVLNGQLERLVYQFIHDPVTSSNQHLASKVEVMLSYHHTFFHSEGELPLSLVLILVLVVLSLRPATRRSLSPAAQYLLLLLGIFWLLTKSNTSYYYLLFVPFIVVVLTEYLVGAAAHWLPWQRAVVMSLLALYPAGAVLRAYNLLKENQTYPPTEVENARLAAYMPKQGSRIIGPLDLFFGQMENYRIHSLTYYSYINKKDYHNQLSLDSFFALAAQDSAEYVVTDHRHLNYVYLVPANAPARIGHYERVFRDDWHSVYRRRP